MHPPLPGNFFPDCLVFVVFQSTQILLSASDSYALSHPPIKVRDKLVQILVTAQKSDHRSHTIIRIIDQDIKILITANASNNFPHSRILAFNELVEVSRTL